MNTSILYLLGLSLLASTALADYPIDNNGLTPSVQGLQLVELHWVSPSNDKVNIADNTTLTSCADIVGFAASSISYPSRVEVIDSGVITWPSTLFRGETYYLNTGGGLTPNKPSGAGVKCCIVGKAKDTYELKVRIPAIPCN